MPSRWKSKRGLAIREVVIFAMLGTVMFVSKLLMEGLPNMHLIGVLTVVYTLVYRWKALCPLYVFVFLTGLYGGFNLWWLPYLYIWAVLWGATMLLPRRMPAWLAPVVYALVCGAHGFLYGTLKNGLASVNRHRVDCLARVVVVQKSHCPVKVGG